MTRDDIIRNAEAELVNRLTSEAIRLYARAYDAGIAAEREKVAKWMIEKGYATGHGDTVEDLLKALEWQAKERARGFL
jgi:TPR repeat protein